MKNNKILTIKILAGVASVLALALIIILGYSHIPRKLTKVVSLEKIETMEYRYSSGVNWYSYILTDEKIEETKQMISKLTYVPKRYWCLCAPSKILTITYKDGTKITIDNIKVTKQKGEEIQVYKANVKYGDFFNIIEDIPISIQAMPSANT